MRQESESQHNSVSGYTVESGESRKERIDKKRAIRKNKVGLINEESFEQKQDKRFLTKQQKMQLQKAKNRQAAQRSRDQHKKYVQTLEEQNRILREELSRPRFCAKCSKEISFESQLSTDPSSTEFQHQRHFETFVQNQNIHEQDDFQSPFMRMSDYEDSSPLKMLLFISMIILGVMVLNGSTDGPTVEGITLKRDLMQIPNQKVIQTPNVNNGQIKPEIQIQASELKFKQLHEISRFDLMNQIENSFNMEDSDENDKIMTEVVPLSYQLSALSQQSCLKSIINDNYTQVSYAFPTKLQQKSASKLRSHDSHQMQIFYPQVKQQKNNLLFCSLPKLYKKSGEVGSNLFSKFIDIIISGSQMMEIIGKSPNLWMSKIVNFNGIYKINAQVKEIVQIEDNNCIL